MTQTPEPGATHRQGDTQAADSRIAAGPYMITLCHLEAPVAIRPPKSQQLRNFRFFVSRSEHADEGPRFHLNMGYFGSLAEAERWAQALRGRYPGATAAPISLPMLQSPGSGVPVLLPSSGAAVAPAVADHRRSDAETLTDTQVIRVLEARRVTPAEHGGEKNVSGVSVVPPEDTSTRRALKDAVIHGTSVSFAVQLMFSASDINLANVPSLSIFRAYTLYKAGGVRDGRAWHCLRLGFFRDAISAKQVAYYVRSHFASVAVVPITEQERVQATGQSIDPVLLSDEFQRSIDRALEADRAQKNPPPVASASAERSASPASARRPAASKRNTSLEQTLDMLAESEMWNDPESHGETGVRHLKVEFGKSRSSR
jgi:hypothetical protein